MDSCCHLFLYIYKKKRMVPILCQHINVAIIKALLKIFLNIIKKKKLSVVPGCKNN